MSVHPLTRGILLVPQLVRIMHKEMSAKACRKRGVGLLRKDLVTLADPNNAGAERILREICRNCPLACELARRE